MSTQKEFMNRISSSIVRHNSDLPFKPALSAYQAWEAELPLLNTPLSCNMFKQTAQGILSSAIPATDKLDLAEAAIPCLNKLLTAGKSFIQDAKLPLSASQADIFSLLLATLTSFSHIYLDIICRDSVTKPQSGSAALKKENIDNSRVIFRALELYNARQLLMSFVYLTPSPLFWGTVNALFALTEYLEVGNVNHPTFNKKGLSNAEREFKKIHFFHLAQPNRFNQRDLKALEAILAMQSDHILLSKTNSNAMPLVVNISSNTPINFLSEEPVVINNSCRYLSSEALIEFLLSGDALAPEKENTVVMASNTPVLSQHSLEQLMPSFKAPQHRHFARHPQNDEVFVHPGFDSIIRALVLRLDPTSYGKKSAKLGAPAVFNIPDLHLVPIEQNSLYQRSTHNDHVINSLLKETANNDPKAENIWQKKSTEIPGEKGKKIAAKVEDSSLHGLLFKVIKQQSLLKVNDIIGIEKTGKNIQLAIIRRLNTHADGTIFTGVEMISPNVKLASIKHHDKKISSTPAIFLQGIPAIKQADAMITQLQVKEALVDISLKTKEGEEVLFSISETLESNPIFNHYSLTKKTEFN